MKASLGIILRISSAGLLSIIFALSATLAWAQDAGQAAFQRVCAPCHTIGGGRLVGPDLAGVQQRRSSDWLQRFISSSQTVIKSGDPQAVAIFDQYNKIIMPDPPVSQAEITQILNHIKLTSAAASGDKPATATAGASPNEIKQQGSTAASGPVTGPASDAAASNNALILAGQNYFQGTERFENRGPACNSCHEIRNDAVIGGGILAVELTTVFSRMGHAGVQAIIGQPPFPVMQAAYKNEPLRKQEVQALVAFLEDANAHAQFHQPRDYGMGLFGSGVIGAGVIFGLCGFVFRARKKESVNQAIYDRQTPSS